MARKPANRDRRKPSRAAPDLPEAASVARPALERYLGSVIRALRQRDHLTIADVASQAGISRGMLSKIETGQAAMSLDTLSRIAQALGVSMAQMFRDYELPAGGAQLVKAAEGMEVVRRGTKRGHTYHLLAYDKGPRKSFEPFLVTMDDASEVFPSFEHPGTEFIYLLKGKIEYRHGKQTYVLEPGDALDLPRRRPARPRAADPDADSPAVRDRLRTGGSGVGTQACAPAALCGGAA